MVEYIDSDNFKKNYKKKKNKLIYVNEKINEKINEIVKDNFNKLYDHEWINYIYLHLTLDEEYYHIFFKNIFISKIKIEELNNKNILKKLLFDIIDKIKNKNIILSIYYLPDIININYEIKKLFAIQDSNKELNCLFIKKELIYRKQCINNMYDILFSIKNNKISFYVKYFKLFECSLVDIEENLKNNKLFDLYNEIKKTKTKILLFLNDELYYDNDFILDLFKLGYWIDLKLEGAEFKNEMVEVELVNNYFMFYYYDIIIFDSQSFKQLQSEIKLLFPTNNYFHDLIKKKKIIVLNKCLSFDMVIYRGLNLLVFSEKFLEKYKLNQFIDYIIPSFLEYVYNDSLNEKHWEYKQLNEIKSIIDKKLSYNIIIGPQLLISKKNNFLLSKNDFMDLNGLDKSKKNCILCTSLPTYYHDKYLFENNYFFLHNLKKILNDNNYNMLITYHPSDAILYNKKNVFVNKNARKGVFKNYEHLKYLNNNFLINDDTYRHEIWQYSDNCIVFGRGSSCSYLNTLFNVPCLNILFKPYSEAIWIDRHTSKGQLLGEEVYYDKLMKNFKETISNFLNKTQVYKDNYKYYDNNPFWGNTYNKMYQEFKTIIDNRIKQYKLKNNIYNNCFVLLEKYFIKYGEPFIKIELNKLDIIISIEKEETPTSYGLSIPIYQKEYNDILNFKFLCKMNQLEDQNIFIKIYTGIEWIILNQELTTDYKLFEIKDKFNLYNKSRWRISTTSKKKGQKIFIKNIEFIDN